MPPKTNKATRRSKRSIQEKYLQLFAAMNNEEKYRQLVFHCAYMGWRPILEEEIKRNPQILFWTDECGRTLLHWASLNNINLELVMYLVQSGIPVDVIDNAGATPLLLAANRGGYNIVRFLVENGTNVNHRSGINYRSPSGLGPGLEVIPPISYQPSPEFGEDEDEQETK